MRNCEKQLLPSIHSQDHYTPVFLIRKDRICKSVKRKMQIPEDIQYCTKINTTKRAGESY